MNSLPVFGEGWGGVRERSEPKKEPHPALPEGGEAKGERSEARYAALFHSQAATSRAPRSGHKGAARKACWVVPTRPRQSPVRR
jgi:hypothetical protein